MKKYLYLFIAMLFTASSLFGCSGKNGVHETPAPELTESPLPTGAVISDSPSPTEIVITSLMALDGVKSYCESEMGYSEGGTDGSTLTMGMGNETEYEVIFRSYTGAFLYFYVDKASGAVRMVEYVPALDIENEAGSFDLFDYWGKEPSAEPANPPDVTPAATAEPTEPPKQEGHYVFNPKVCSVYMEEVFGKTMCDTWFELVDAVMAGEDTFACPDQHTYDWVMGQFPCKCFPILTELIDYAWDRPNAVKEGVAGFTYLVPKKEAAERIAAFAAQVEGILNEALEDDYSDFEKALALYVYFAQNYRYDWDTYAKMSDEYVEYTTTYRFFETGMGICSEISPAYSYLLMQAGVEATTMMGSDHEWSYVRIGGNDYHIDPTFVIGDAYSLSYFMMTDEQRDREGYPKEEYVITSNYSKDNPHPDYVACDDTFAPLWDEQFGIMFDDEDRLLCWRYTEGWESEYSEFDYTGY